MKANNKKLKIYNCTYCEDISEIVGIVQTELHYYSVDLSTNQWEDFHGDESVASQRYFCINCSQTINSDLIQI